jgi:hypothetical protein
MTCSGRLLRFSDPACQDPKLVGSKSATSLTATQATPARSAVMNRGPLGQRGPVALGACHGLQRRPLTDPHRDWPAHNGQPAQPVITIPMLAGAASIAAALRYHARRPSLPLQTIRGTNLIDFAGAVAGPATANILHLPGERQVQSQNEARLPQEELGGAHMSPSITFVSLGEIPNHPTIQFGTKAQNLYQVQLLGLRVPDSICVAADLAKHLYGLVNIEQLGGIAANEPQNFAAAYESAARELGELSKIDPGLGKVIQHVLEQFTIKRGLIVRSSSVAEDLAGHSYAGVYDSVVGVFNERQLQEAMDRVLASGFGHRFFEYQRAKGATKLEPAPMGVLIQELAYCAISGVAYQPDPTPFGGSIYVEYIPGLPEPLLAGRVTPMAGHIDELGTVHLLEPGRVNTQLIVQDGALITAIADSQGSYETLFRKVAKELGAAASILENTFGPALDIEWGAGSDGSVTFLQIRSQ